MYTYIGLGLMSVFALMIIPGNFGTVDNGLVFYGAGTITQYNSEGNEVFSQTVHNQLVDTGEDFMLDRTFEDGAAAVADNAQIGAICLYANAALTVAEGNTSATFDAADNLTENNCIEDTIVITAGGIATVNPATTFTCAGINCANGDTISGFGVCQNSAGGSPFANCATNGVLFALIDSANTQLNAGETLDITYNFNVTSPNT